MCPFGGQREIPLPQAHAAPPVDDDVDERVAAHLGTGYHRGVVLLLALVTLASADEPARPPNSVPKSPPGPPSWGETIAPVETGILRGQVVERGSGLPVAGTVTAGDQSTPIGPDGSFSLAVPPGVVAVTVDAVDHAPLALQETIAANAALEVIYRVERFSWTEEVTVYGEEQREEVARMVISADELRQVPGSFGDPIRALQSLPGVARPASLEGSIVVRGAEGVNTGFYVDEVPIPYMFHFFVGRSVINPAMLDDVEFYPGGMPSRFGDVTQAIVNARTLDTKPARGWHGRVSADLLDFAASGEGRLTDHITWQGGYRLSWIGGLIGTSAKVYATLKGFGDFRPPYPTLSYEDHMARLAWEDGRDRVVLTWLGARDAFIFHPPKSDWDGDGDIEAPPLPPGLPYDPYRLMDSGFHRIHLRWDRNVGDREQVTWLAVGPDRTQSLLQGIGLVADGIDFGKLNGVTIVGRRRDRIPVGNDVVQLGLDGLVDPVTVRDYGQIDENGTVPTTKDLRASFAAWGELQHDFGTTWFAPGFRMSAHSFNGQQKLEPEPRISIRHPIADHWTMTGFIGRFSQIPPADRYAKGIGNPNLTIMTAYQASAGVEGRFPSGLDVDATLYASRTADQVVKDSEVRIEESQNLGDSGVIGPSGYAQSVLVPLYRPVTGYAFGFEGMLRMRPQEKWFGWVAFTLGKSLRVDDEGVVRPGDYDLPVSLTVVGARELPKEWNISGRLRLTSGYPYTPLYGVYVSQWDEWRGLPGDENSARFAFFKQIDVRIDKTWTAKRARWTLYLDAYNALNTKNWFLATYDPTFDHLEPEIWIPIIPTLGVEVKY
jgi:hypothetical protein